MESPSRYTRFPSLHDVENPSYETTSIEIRWPNSIPVRDLVLAWARLLKAYSDVTGPVFILSRQAVRVNTSSSTWRAVEVEEDEDSIRGTSMLIDQVRFPWTSSESKTDTSCWRTQNPLLSVLSMTLRTAERDCHLSQVCPRPFSRIS